jgi:hypothetical protein
MASTGLLNVNPYQKGVVFDISSKPTNLAIQLEQREAIKRDALDKYYMEYEKTLNPAGMRGQDQDVFLKKFGQAKSYFLQNRDCILNPSKCGAEAQSAYLGYLKDAQGIITQSKQEAENEKADRAHYQRATEQGLDVPDGYLDAVALSHLRLDDPRRVALDPYKYNFTKKFDEDAFFKTVNRGLTPSVTKEIQNPDGKGNINTLTTYAYTPEDKLTVAKNSRVLYGNDAAFTNMTNKLIKSGAYVNFQDQYKELYPGKDITKAKPEEVAEAIGLSFTPNGKTIAGQKEDKKYWMNEQDKLTMKHIAANKSALGGPQDTINYINNGLGLLQGDGNESAANNYFNYWKSQNKGVLGGYTGFTDIKKVSPGVWKFNYNVPSSKGVPIPESITIEAGDPAARNKLYALHQQFLGSNARAEALLPRGEGTGEPAPNKKTWAEIQAEKNKKK